MANRQPCRSRDCLLPICPPAAFLASSLLHTLCSLRGVSSLDLAAPCARPFLRRTLSRGFFVHPVGFRTCHSWPSTRLLRLCHPWIWIPQAQQLARLAANFGEQHQAYSPHSSALFQTSLSPVATRFGPPLRVDVAHQRQLGAPAPWTVFSRCAALVEWGANDPDCS